MVYCTKCGTQFDGKFCPNCGAPVEGSAIPPRDTAFSPQTIGTREIPANWAGVLCYVVPIAGPLIFLFLAPYNRDTGVRFHAWQALFLQLAWLAAHTIGNVFTGISWRLTALVHEIVGLVYLIAVLLLAIRTYQGEKLVLPVIGPLAERQK